MSSPRCSTSLRERADEALEQLGQLSPELPGRIEANDPSGEVLDQDGEPGAADELVRERESGEDDPVLGNTVLSESAGCARCRDQITDAGPCGVEGYPDSIHVGVGDDAGHFIEAGLVSQDRRSIEGREERALGPLEFRDERSSQAAGREPMEHACPARGGRAILEGIERGNVGRSIQYPSQRRAQERDLGNAGRELVGVPCSTPEPRFRLLGEGSPIRQGDGVAKGVADGASGAKVSVPHLHGDDERAPAMGREVSVSSGRHV